MSQCCRDTTEPTEPQQELPGFCSFTMKKLLVELRGLPASLVSGDALTSKLEPKTSAQQEATPFTSRLLAGSSEQLHCPSGRACQALCHRANIPKLATEAPVPATEGAPLSSVSGESGSG